MSSPSPSRFAFRRRGFTLIEVVVVFALIGVLLGLTLSAVSWTRIAADRARCQNHLRQQALAILNYESTHGCLPPGAISGPFAPLGVTREVAHGLWPVVLAQLGEDALARRYSWDAAYDDPANAGVVAAPLAVLRCPASRDAAGPAEPAWADFGAIDVNPFLADIGLIDPAAKFEGALPVNGQVKLNDLTDGAAQTLLIVEAPGANAWASPSTLVPARYYPGEGRHRGGSNVAFADGSVRLLGRETSLRTVARLASRAGGEPVAANDY